ncbi:MAG TPA: hypothetical protein VIE65_04455 [Methylobacter sp.]
MNAPKKNNPWHPVFAALSIFIVGGYVLYLSALLLPSPLWAVNTIEWFKPIVKSLQTAASVGLLHQENPFPAQVVILYCALATIVLILFCSYWLSFHREVYEVTLANYENKPSKEKASKRKLLVTGVIGPLMFSLMLYWAFWAGRESIDWRTIAFYSSNIGSATFLLITGLIAIFIISISGLAIRISISVK